MAIKMRLISFASEVKVSKPSKNNKNTTEESVYNLSAESKKSGRDFGYATATATKLRKAFAPILALTADKKLINRLNKRFITVLKTVSESEKGAKNFKNSKISLLQGFEFNQHTSLENLLRIAPLIEMMEDGILKISIPALPTATLIEFCNRKDTANLHLMVFSLDLIGDQHKIFKAKTLVLPFTTPDFKGAHIELEIDQQGEQALFVAMGITYAIDGTVSGDRRYYASKLVTAINLREGKIVEFEPEILPPPANHEEEDDGDWTAG